MSKSREQYLRKTVFTICHISSWNHKKRDYNLCKEKDEIVLFYTQYKTWKQQPKSVS